MLYKNLHSLLLLIRVEMISTTFDKHINISVLKIEYLVLVSPSYSFSHYTSTFTGTYAFQNMPVGEATVLISMAPVFVAMFSACFLGESIS